MIDKNIYKFFLSGIILFSFVSCNLLQKKYVYNSGEVNQNIYSDIEINRKIGIQDTTSTKVKGRIKNDKEGLPNFMLTFKNTHNKNLHKTFTDFDGFYSINIPAGEYLVMLDYYGQQDNLTTKDKTIFEFNSGEIRQLDWFISVGPETSVSYSIEFKSKRAYKKALKKAKELNMSLLEYSRLEK